MHLPFRKRDEFRKIWKELIRLLSLHFLTANYQLLCLTRETAYLGFHGYMTYHGYCD
jgi:hypothetical protein